MGLLDWLSSKKKAAGDAGRTAAPEPLNANGLARLAAGNASAHVLELAHSLGNKGPSPAWVRVHSELVRGYYGLAALFAHRCLKDPLAFNEFCVRLAGELAEMGDGEILDAHRGAFSDGVAFEEAGRLYVRGEPSLKDQMAMEQAESILQPNRRNDLSMLCAHLHLRATRIVDVGVSDPRLAATWPVTLQRVQKAWTQFEERLTC
jgi:hypothetical protein